ncbi:MAG: hypothetical protein U0841_29820 [Chloroflexia bacterium]
MVQQRAQPGQGAADAAQDARAAGLRPSPGWTRRRARELRDGAEGWSILFIACYLRDSTSGSSPRASRRCWRSDDPTPPSMDNEALAREGEYVDQSLFAVREDLRARRAALIAPRRA